MPKTMSVVWRAASIFVLSDSCTVPETAGGSSRWGAALGEIAVAGYNSHPFIRILRLSSRMPSVRVRENEPFEVALRRFKRTCEKAGVLTDVRKH